MAQRSVYAFRQRKIDNVPADNNAHFVHLASAWQHRYEFGRWDNRAFTPYKVRAKATVSGHLRSLVERWLGVICSRKCPNPLRS